MPAPVVVLPRGVNTDAARSPSGPGTVTTSWSRARVLSTSSIGAVNGTSRRDPIMSAVMTTGSGLLASTAPSSGS